MSEIDRRGFLKVVGQGALAAALADLLLAGKLVSVARGDDGADIHVLGVRRHPTQAEVDQQVERALRECFDLDMVKPGHLVLVKVASNSPKPYPFTSHPMVVSAVCRLMKARGARVVVLDQCGSEHVVHLADSKMASAVEKIWGKTFSGYTNGLQVLEANGLAKAARDAGAEVFSLDHDSDYVNVDLGSPAWPARSFAGQKQGPGARLAKLAVDAIELAKQNPPAAHVISISRPGGHVQAGHTGPIKTWYGWVHPADRLWSHLDISRVKNGSNPHDTFQHHGFLGMPFLGQLEVSHLHESVAAVASWMEQNLPIRAHIVGAIDDFCDVGPDWGQVAMKGPNVIAAAPRGKVAQLDAFVAALVVSEKAATSQDEKHDQAVANDKREHMVLRDRLQTRFMYRMEHAMHDMHGTHFMEPAVAALRDPKQRSRDQGAVWAFRQIDAVLESTGGKPGIKMDVEGTTLTPELQLLLQPPTPQTIGIEGSLGKTGH